MEEKIEESVLVSMIEAELTPDKFLRNTNKANNQIYIVDAFDSPNVMKEIGRLREIAFRAAGGGTGKALWLHRSKCCNISALLPRACKYRQCWSG